MASYVPHVYRFLQSVFSKQSMHVREEIEGANVPALWKFYNPVEKQSSKKQDGEGGSLGDTSQLCIKKLRQIICLL